MPLPLSALLRAAGLSGRRRLPARVEDAIRAQQASSEILIGWIQLGIVCTFGTLFALSPPPRDGVTAFQPEPWFLSAYLLFTLLRLGLAHRRILPGWLLYFSTVLDMALLLALIWSFHIKYGQPASFYLKTPTLLYVFIFISLRALRYEVRYVVVAGAVAAAGWLLMVLYVIKVDPDDPMITRNYVEYLTSNSVLLGAEFDKVISILMVTGILALAIGRARSLLERAISEEVTARELSRFVPRRVVEQVASAERPMEAGQGELREATVFFSDIEGFTTIGERLDPTTLIATLNEFFSIVSAPITAAGGVINQFQGDAVLATFNLPDHLEGHAKAAVSAALDIQDALARHTFANGLALRARIGINTGVVVGGLVGTGDRLVYTVHGDEVNLAARLEQLNKERGTRILVSGATRRAAEGPEFRFERLAEVKVRGRNASVTLYTVSRAGSEALEAATPSADPNPG